MGLAVIERAGISAISLAVRERGTSSDMVLVVRERKGLSLTWV
jgi:hypothetical protein